MSEASLCRLLRRPVPESGRNGEARARVCREIRPALLTGGVDSGARPLPDDCAWPCRGRVEDAGDADAGPYALRLVYGGSPDERSAQRRRFVRRDSGASCATSSASAKVLPTVWHQTLINIRPCSLRAATQCANGLAASRPILFARQRQRLIDQHGCGGGRSRPPTGIGAVETDLLRTPELLSPCCVRTVMN